MKLKEVDYVISEELFATSRMLNMICDAYNGKLPKDVMQSLEHTILLAERHIEENFIPKVDIKDIKFLSRVTFNMDSLKELKKYKKENNI